MSQEVLSDYQRKGWEIIKSDNYYFNHPATGAVYNAIEPYEVALAFTPIKFGTSSRLATTTQSANPLRFSQRTASSTFSNSDKTPILFKNKPIEQLSAEIRAGTVNPSQVPVSFVQGNGVRLIVNSRSSLSLIRANVPTNQWNLVNRTGQSGFETRMTRRLFDNNLTNQGTNVIRCGGCWWQIP